MAEAIAGALGTSVATVQTGMMVAAVATSMYAANQQAQNQAAIAKANAANTQILIEQERNALKTEAAEKALDNVRQLRVTLAQNSAYYAATGADLSSGTPNAVQEKNMEEANRQLKVERVATMLKDTRLQSESEMSLGSGNMQASAYRSQGYWSAAGSLMSGLDRYASRGKVKGS
jgi:hypothetical protein